MNRLSFRLYGKYFVLRIVHSTQLEVCDGDQLEGLSPSVCQDENRRQPKAKRRTVHERSRPGAGSRSPWTRPCPSLHKLLPVTQMAMLRGSVCLSELSWILLSAFSPGHWKILLGSRQTSIREKPTIHTFLKGSTEALYFTPTNVYLMTIHEPESFNCWVPFPQWLLLIHRVSLYPQTHTIPPPINGFQTLSSRHSPCWHHLEGPSPSCPVVSEEAVPSYIQNRESLELHHLD